MAALASLIIFLEQGYTIRSESGNQTLTPSKVGKRLIFDLHTHETKSRPAKFATLTPGEVRRLSSIWEWGIVFIGVRGQEYVIEDLQAIEQAIRSGQLHTLYDVSPNNI